MHKKRRPQRNPIPPYRPEAEPLQMNPELATAIRNIIDAQLAKNDPPETRATLERLVADGYTREGAYNLIATAVVSEIVTTMQQGQTYDMNRYLAALAQLGIRD
jgi:hypothetical protein